MKSFTQLHVLYVITTVVLITVGSVVGQTIATPEANPLEEKESCYQLCGKTYSLHTYPKSQHLNACERGCRLAILSHLNVAKDTSITFDPQLVANKCFNACSSAYDVKHNSSEYFACTIGCNNTVTTVGVDALNGHDIRPKVQSVANDDNQAMGDSINDSDADNRNEMFISPINMFRSLFASLVNRAEGPVVMERSSMSVFLSRNSEGESKIMVVQSEPEVVVNQYPDLMHMNEYDSESVTGSEEHITTDYNRPKLDVSIWTQENPLDVVNSRHVEKSWSNCFPYESGVPRWVLASVLFLAMFVLVWICCATTTTAPEQHIRARKVGQGSDLKYLCLYEEPVKLMIDDKLPTYEELEAQKQFTESNDIINKNTTDCKE